jgi:hypothetical protein
MPGLKLPDNKLAQNSKGLNCCFSYLWYFSKLSIHFEWLRAVVRESERSSKRPLMSSYNRNSVLFEGAYS